ncbi:MAG: heparinase II/III family protein, partial [Pseudomonadota bacterium]
AQLLADGGHVCRSPQRTLEALADLLVLRDLLDRAGRTVPSFFEKWIPRMVSMVSFFRTGDGALCAFNDGGESRPEAVEAVLDHQDGAARRFSFAMKSGFQKLQAHELSLVLDAGAAPPRPYGGHAHAGALGFELSDGPARIVSSCGFSPEISLDWQAAVRRTAAHSTLGLAGRDSAAFERFEATRLLVPIGPEGISAKRLEEANEIWLDAQHAGWKSSFGLIHRRRLFMSGDGERLTGEDALVRPISQGLDEEGSFIGFDIRFHLHPSVTALVTGDAIQLKCENGALWRFRTTHAEARLESSRYLGRGLVESTEQIVMSGRADRNGDGSEPPNCVRWVFRREKAAG